MVDFLEQAQGLRDQLVAWRRDFHRHPELGYEEYRTAGMVAGHLERLGYRVQTGVGETGVVGVLEGARPGPVIMLRFDMDALPVQEETGVEYASQVEGMMHACGHDGHIAIGFGVAEILAAECANLGGVFKLIFQPAEEGGNGAERMIQDGVLEDPRPDLFLATHIWTDKVVGTADVTVGPVMAMADKFACTIRGHGGHGAAPHQAVDPVVATAQAISTLQTVVSRNVPPLESAVVTVGSIHGGDAFNVIPSHVELSGTVRTFLKSTQGVVLQRLQEVFEGVAQVCGAEAEVEIIRLTPAVVNDARVTESVRKAAEAILGPDQVSSEQRTMGSEDAAFFMEHIPGCYFFLGGANPEKGLGGPHHNPHFNFDEEALVLGVAILAHVVAGYTQ